ILARHFSYSGVDPFDAAIAPVERAFGLPWLAPEPLSSRGVAGQHRLNIRYDDLAVLNQTCYRIWLWRLNEISYKEKVVRRLQSDSFRCTLRCGGHVGFQRGRSALARPTGRVLD